MMLNLRTLMFVTLGLAMAVTVQTRNDGERTLIDKVSEDIETVKENANSMPKDMVKSAKEYMSPEGVMQYGQEMKDLAMKVPAKFSDKLEKHSEAKEDGSILATIGSVFRALYGTLRFILKGLLNGRAMTFTAAFFLTLVAYATVRIGIPILGAVHFVAVTLYRLVKACFGYGKKRFVDGKNASFDFAPKSIAEIQAEYGGEGMSAFVGYLSSPVSQVSAEPMAAFLASQSEAWDDEALPMRVPMLVAGSGAASATGIAALALFASVMF